MLGAGQRNKQISLLNVSYSNDEGELKPVWTLYKTTWANVRGVSAREEQVAKNFAETVTLVFTVLFDPAIVTTMVIQWEGKTAAINGVVDAEGRRKELTIYATETVNDQPPNVGDPCPDTNVLAQFNPYGTIIPTEINPATLAVIPATFTAGNIATFNGAGNVVDSGNSPASFDAAGAAAAVAAALATAVSTLSPIAGSSSLTTLGTITSGTWTGTTIAVSHGGTGATTSTGTGAVVLATAPTFVTNITTPTIESLTSINPTAGATVTFHGGLTVSGSGAVSLGGGTFTAGAGCIGVNTSTSVTTITGSLTISGSSANFMGGGSFTCGAGNLSVNASTGLTSVNGGLSVTAGSVIMGPGNFTAAASTFQINSSTGLVTLTGAITGATTIAATTALNIGGGKTTVSGSAGSAIFAMPFAGASYKKVVIYCNGLTGAVSYTFPTAFLDTPAIVTTNGLASTLITALSTTALTVTGSTSTGFIILEGF